MRMGAGLDECKIAFAKVYTQYIAYKYNQLRRPEDAIPDFTARIIQSRAFFKKLPVGGPVYIRDLLVMTEGTSKLWDMLT